MSEGNGPVRHRLTAMLRVARISLVYADGPVQRLQVDDGDLGSFGGRRVVDNVAHMLQFGFASAPPLKSEVLLGALGGDRSQTIAIGTNHQPSRPRNLKPGDTAVYDVRGQIVQLTEDGLLIDCAGLPAVIRNFETLTVQGDIHVTGDVISRAGAGDVSLNGLHDAYNAHKHPGVTSGAASTGTTDHQA